MSQIRISPDQMDERAAAFRAERDHVGDVIAKMDSLLGALQSEWEGNTSQQFQQAYSELRPGFVKAQELIERIAATLNKKAEDFRLADGQ